MADLPVPQLGHRTPLMAAHKPNMDQMARMGLAGLVKTVPDGLSPGSDTANMSVMGYDPQLYYTGRSPLEAISMSIDMEPGDVAFRCNLITLSESAGSNRSTGAGESGDPLAGRIMDDYSADEIGSDEAARLIEAINEPFADHQFRFYPGKSYRHCLIWKKGMQRMALVPPHDILTRPIDTYLPSGPGAEPLLAMMRKSTAILSQHPVNQARRRRQLNPANAIWIWGQGTKPELPDLTAQFGLRGSVISAVDLVNGLGICSGLHVVDVPGATGNIHTNFQGKAQAVIHELERGQNYIYVHVEAPDECGHRAEINNKVRSIELIDEQIIGPVWRYLENLKKSNGEDYRLLLLPDHPTPLALRTHTADPVPFAVYSSDGRDLLPAATYDEDSCQKTGVFIAEGHRLLTCLIQNGFN